MKIKYWLDSGANAQSRYDGETTLDELGVSREEWDAMTYDERENLIRECAFEFSDWGYYIEGED